MKYFILLLPFFMFSCGDKLNTVHTKDLLTTDSLILYLPDTRGPVNEYVYAGVPFGIDANCENNAYAINMADDVREFCTIHLYSVALDTTFTFTRVEQYGEIISIESSYFPSMTILPHSLWSKDSKYIKYKKNVD